MPNKQENNTGNEEIRKENEMNDVKTEGSNDPKSQVKGRKGKEDKKDAAMLEKKLAAMEEDLQKKESEVVAVKEVLLRRQADFENYKKRVIRTQEEQKKLAIKDLSLDIITINDDLLRAIKAAEDVPQDESLPEAHESFVEGVKLISNQIEGALEKYGIEEIDSMNQEFDPNYNEAVEINMSEDVDKDTITKVYQKGFRLDDYVIRSAKVCVSKPLKAAQSESSEENKEEENTQQGESG